MISFEKLVITAPGSTANLGPGFDSIGLALNRYTTLEVTPHHEWLFIPRSPELEGIPSGKENLVYQVVEAVAQEFNRELPPCKVEVYSDIPLSRGLGSSAAAVICGIELANQLLELDLTLEERLRISSLMEGHPDNVAASLYGGLNIGSHREDGTDVVHAGRPEVDIIVYIPHYELKTEKARSVLPVTMSFKESVKASGISNVLTAAIIQGNWELAGKMMRKDLFHEPHRGGLVPELNDVISFTTELGAYGAALSGAGPTVICFAPRGKGSGIAKQLEAHFENASVASLQVDERGLTVEKIQLQVEKQPSTS